MKDEQLKTLVKYRIKLAYETLHEADILFKENFFRGTINRAYYAMFYSVLALLAIKKLGNSKHSGAISLFDREFVNTGIFPKELSKNLRLAFDRRQTHDYGEVIEIDRDTAQLILENAKRFIKEVESYLDKQGYLN